MAMRRWTLVLQWTLRLAAPLLQMPSPSPSSQLSPSVFSTLCTSPLVFISLSLFFFLPSMAALATHYSSTRCTYCHRHRSNKNSTIASNHAGSTSSSTAPLLPLLPCRRHPHSALPYHPSLASSSKVRWPSRPVPLSLFPFRRCAAADSAVVVLFV